MTRKRSAYHREESRAVERPAGVADGALSPGEAAAYFAWSFWPAPRRLLSCVEVSQDLCRVRLEKVGCEYEGRREKDAVGRLVWAFYRTEVVWGVTL